MADFAEKIALFDRWIAESQYIVFLGGAGVSTESGIPDFRSEDGLYHQQYRWPPEVMLSRSFFDAYPEEFYAFYRAKMLPLEAKPNATHRVLAQWERAGKLKAIITQNIDGLHQAAGSTCVLELHGSIHRNFCQRCGKSYSAEFMRDSTGVPRCSCGGVIKPDVVLYEECLDTNILQQAEHHIRNADMMIVGGTSLAVYPAAGLLHYFSGKHLVLVNRSSTPFDEQADLLLSESLGKVFSALRPI